VWDNEHAATYSDAVLALAGRTASDPLARLHRGGARHGAYPNCNNLYERSRVLTQGDVVFVEIRGRLYDGAEPWAICDLTDLDLIQYRSWILSGSVWGSYAQTGFPGRRSKVYMHTLIAGQAGGLHVDHINGDKLDNRRINLRHVTNAQNQYNSRSAKGSSSSFKGVHYCKQTGRWSAHIMVDGKNVWLRRHDTEIAAALAYDAAALRYFGEHARLNIPSSDGRVYPLSEAS
jgi:hypothetical protein